MAHDQDFDAQRVFGLCEALVRELALAPSPDAVLGWVMSFLARKVMKGEPVVLIGGADSRDVLRKLGPELSQQAERALQQAGGDPQVLRDAMDSLMEPLEDLLDQHDPGLLEARRLIEEVETSLCDGASRQSRLPARQ